MTKNRGHAAKRFRGFTLVEMAFVLAIVGLLLGGLLVSLTAQLEQQRTAETRKALEEIKDALIGFAMANGRLPCPADPTIATGQPNAGVERATCTNAGASVSGVVPWVTLGVSETDAWGRRYTYRVTQSFADAISANTVSPPATCTTVPAQSSFALCSKGQIEITDGTADIADDIPAVIVSHGNNGLGAYRSDGTQIPGAAGDELENANTDANFVSHTPTPTYDDIVAWLPLNILLARMVAAQKLP